jgi:hypothetical protein
VSNVEMTWSQHCYATWQWEDLFVVGSRLRMVQYCFKGNRANKVAIGALSALTKSFVKKVVAFEEAKRKKE